MKRIGLLSDTHSYLDTQILDHFKNCDEIWHAGGWGSYEVYEKLSSFKKVRGVFGNIDGREIRLSNPQEHHFAIEDISVYMTHIGGYPPNRYEKGIRDKLKHFKPNLYICGHSHICKVIPDKNLNVLHMNPGAAGKYGMHQIRTVLRFEIDHGKIQNLQAIELGKRV